ncbi:Spy/CpxP family protein refolding chaperone [Winogradskyella sp.]|uniref:Spy/CpxP family protein refolding chaperone n=1 Tax=Winogradskyella sp. TaxID=1883156 RepID=UPI002616BAE0|nr:Spy/CpxP family protein refolding chaperone [Winogradskyella sp.]
MKKQLPLYILLVFLIVVNGFFLFKYLGEAKENKSKGPKSPDSFITNRLNFNNAQLKQFNALERTHREKMMTLSEQIRATKDALFDKISEPNADNSVIDSITSVIGEYEKKKDLEVFKHFRAIYNICDNNQKEAFEDLVKDALHKGPPTRGRRPPRGKVGKEHGPPPPRH